ncbi:hypothetical protein AK812_SmicGene16897 [Symbiodinium microadriaticum]|uniref:Uncharacterized protein n=1 Tax=Symbiodinium microadriaticum TaxID=2951 RepID=A0A1Q9DZ51_SYMMI|nr:hypothetical protein AK812_SmicGene16897 [Symbiodinium microadriaticum]
MEKHAATGTHLSMHLRFGGSRVTLRWTARAGVLLVMTNDEGCRMSAPVRLSLQGPAGLLLDRPGLGFAQIFFESLPLFVFRLLPRSHEPALQAWEDIPACDELGDVG